MKLSLYALPLIILGLFLLASILINRNAFIQKFKIDQIHYIYTHSQFALDPADRLFVIQDWELYPYAGYVYLTTGDLQVVNFEHPPLGKYLLGLSVLAFKNPAWIQLILAGILILCVYLVSAQILQNHWWGLLVPVFFIQEELFAFNLTHGMLDQLFATLLALYFLLLMRLSVYRLSSTLLIGLVLGLLASTKFPVPVAIFVSLYIGYLGLKLKANAYMHLLVLGLTMIATYLVFYIPLLLSGGFYEFFKIHVQALRLHLGHLPEYPPFAPLRLMFANQWRIWWIPNQLYKQTTEWNIFWPLLAATVMISPAWIAKSFKHLNPTVLVALSTLLYFVFMNTRLFFPHYLYPLLPWLYLFLIILVQKATHKFKLYIRYA